MVVPGGRLQHDRITERESCGRWPGWRAGAASLHGRGPQRNLAGRSAPRRLVGWRSASTRSGKPADEARCSASVPTATDRPMASLTFRTAERPRAHRVSELGGRGLRPAQPTPSASVCPYGSAPRDQAINDRVLPSTRPAIVSVLACRVGAAGLRYYRVFGTVR
jgi:hypothetical protein